MRVIPILALHLVLLPLSVTIAQRAPTRLVLDAPPPPPRQPRASEPLFTLQQGDQQVVCELGSHGEYGVKAQFCEDGEFRRSQRFDTRALATQWASEERKILEPSR